MAEKYHISPSTGNPNRCYANTKPCPLGGSEDHYPTKEAARKGFEKKQNANLSGMKKAKKAAPAAPAQKAAAQKPAPRKATPAAPAKASKGLPTAPAADDDLYDFKNEELEDMEFDPTAVSDEWEDDDPFKEEKDEWGDDDDDVWDSSRMNPDDYEERTGKYTYSWDR